MSEISDLEELALPGTEFMDRHSSTFGRVHRVKCSGRKADGSRCQANRFQRNRNALWFCWRHRERVV